MLLELVLLHYTHYTIQFLLLSNALLLHFPIIIFKGQLVLFAFSRPVWTCVKITVLFNLP